jgi:hypothetical protein
VIEAAETPEAAPPEPPSRLVQPATPETTLEPVPAALPQPSLSWRIDRLRRLKVANAGPPQAGPQSNRPPAPEPSSQPALRAGGFAGWQAMGDRSRLFGFTN